MTKVVVIGEVCIDEYVYGKCERVCPEASALCFNRSINKETSSNLGMAGNVVNNIKSISSNIQCDLISNDYVINPIIKRRFIDEKYNTIVFREDINDICETCNEDLSILKNADYIVISDYNKGFLTHDHYKTIRNIANKATIFADTKKRIDEDLAKCVNFFKINTDEYNKNVAKTNALLKSCQMIVTGGASGCKLMSEKFIKNFDTNQIEVRDVCGAGDTFMAALVVKYIEHKEIQESIKYANKMAGLVVQKLGVSIP